MIKSCSIPPCQTQFGARKALTKQNTIKKTSTPVTRSHKRSVLWAGVLLSVLAANHSKISSLMEIVTKPNGHEIAQSGWEPNVRVLTANGQKASISDGYSKALISKLKDPNISSIEEAQKSLSKEGWRGFLGLKGYPLQTPGENLNIWKKNETGKNRFVLMIAAPEFFKEANNFSKEIQEIYNIPNDNIQKLQAPSISDFVKGFDAISNKLKDKKDAELLVYYSGHGDVSDYPQNQIDAEGLSEGLLTPDFKKGDKTSYSITESKVKELFKDKFKDTPTLFVIDACHSGAWVADAKQPKKTLIQKA